MRKISLFKDDLFQTTNDYDKSLKFEMTMSTIKSLEISKPKECTNTIPRREISIRSSTHPVTSSNVITNQHTPSAFSNVGKSSVFFSCLPTCDQHTMLADRFEHRPQHESSVPHRLCVRGFDSKETHSRHVKRINVEPVACVRVREGEGGGERLSKRSMLMRRRVF